MEATGRPAQYLQLARLVLRMSRTLYSAFDELLEATLDLSTKELFVLRAVQDGAVHPGGIAEKLHVAPSSVSRMLERLTSGGLLRRDLDDADLRRFRVTLTTRGADVIERAREHIADHLSETYAHVPTDDIRAAVTALETLAERMRTAPTT